MAQDLSPAGLRELSAAEALEHVPGYSASAPSELRIKALQGGTLNRSFQVKTTAGDFVLRLHDPAAARLGADHAREAQLQNAAARAGVAPRVLYLDPAQRFMISEYVSGRVWSSKDFSEPAQLRVLAQTFRRLHAVSPGIDAPFDLARLLQSFAERIGQAIASERQQVEQLMEQARSRLAACSSETREYTLFHSDPYHSNIIATPTGVVLVDWEYAAIGDPLYDLACVLAYHPQAQPHAALLLEASGLAAQASLDMLRHATWLYRLLNFFWYRACRLESPASREDLAAEQALRESL